jgi:signal peptidase I
MAKEKKSEFSETLSTIIWAVLIALVLRTFLFQPFHIPSGSMLPTLMKGDYIITSKYSVGYGRYAAAPLPFPSGEGRFLEREPKRGDVLVFRPEGDNKNFIKRLIGLPGDTVQMQEGRLLLNGEPVKLDLVGEENFKDQYGEDVLAEIWAETFPNNNRHIIYDSQKK